MGWQEGWRASCCSLLSNSSSRSHGWDWQDLSWAGPAGVSTGCSGGCDGLCEGSAWEHCLVQPWFLLVAPEAPVQPRVPLYGRNASGQCLLLGVTWAVWGAGLCVAVTVPPVSTAPCQAFSEPARLGRVRSAALFSLSQEITLHEPLSSLWEMMNVSRSSPVVPPWDSSIRSAV